MKKLENRPKSGREIVFLPVKKSKKRQKMAFPGTFFFHGEKKTLGKIGIYPRLKDLKDFAPGGQQSWPTAREAVAVKTPNWQKTGETQTKISKFLGKPQTQTQYK